MRRVATRAAGLLVALLATACSSYLDKEIVERPIPERQVQVAVDTPTPQGRALRHVVERTGVYSLRGGAVRSEGRGGTRAHSDTEVWSGDIGCAGPNGAGGDRFVLQAGDVVDLRWVGGQAPREPLRLIEWDGIRLVAEDVAEQPPEVVLTGSGGDWSLLVRRAARAMPMTQVQVVERSPTEYECDGKKESAAFVDTCDVLSMALFPPLLIGQLAYSKEDRHRLAKPCAWVESIADERLSPAGEPISYRVPVAGATYRWRLRLANTDAVAEDVTTSATGRAELDFRGYLTAIERNIDFGRTGEVDVVETRTGRQLAFPVDLLQIRDAVRARLRTDGGTVPPASR